MKKIFGIILLSVTVASYAANNSYGDSHPVYVDINSGVNTSNNNLGLNANVGYLFNRYYAVEAGLTGSDNYFLYDVAAKGILPLGSIVNLYGKLGVGVNNYSGTNSPTTIGILYGAGVGFNIAHNWEIHVEDDTVTGANPNFLMFGGQYKF